MKKPLQYGKIAFFSLFAVLAMLFTMQSALAALIYNDTMEYGTAAGNGWSDWAYNDTATNGVPAGSNYLNNASLRNLAIPAAATTSNTYQQDGDGASRTTFNMSFHVKFIFKVAPASTTGNIFMGATTQGLSCYASGDGVCIQYVPATDNDEWYFNVGGAGIDTNVVIQNNTWQHFRVEVAGSTIKVYHNETQVGGTQTLLNALSANANALVFAKPSANSGYDVYIDNLQICTGACPSLPVVEGGNIITASLSNLVNDSAIGSVTFRNVTGSLTFDYFNITGSGFCVSYSGNGTGTNCTASGSGASTYYNVSNTTTISGTQTVSASTYQSLANLSAYRLFLNTSIASFNASNDQAFNETTSGSLLLPLNAGTNNVQVNVLGNYSLNLMITGVALTTVQANATGIYDNQFTIGANYNGASINNFTVDVTNTTLGGLLTTQSTTNGSIIFPLLQGYYYTFALDPSNHTLANATLSANATTNLYNFTVYRAQTLNLTFRDEITRDLINETVTLEIISTESATTYTTTNSTFYIDLLAPNNYTLRYRGESYPERDYYLTVSTQSYNPTTLYMITFNASNTVLTRVVDTSGAAVEGAIVKLLRYYVYCNCYEVVEMSEASYSGQGYFNAEYYEGIYKWAVDYQGTNYFLSTTPENLVPGNDETIVTRTFTLALDQNYYEAFNLFNQLGTVIVYNAVTGGLSYTWSDPTDTISGACLDAQRVNGTKYVSVGKTCQNATTGSLLLNLDNTTKYKYAAIFLIQGVEYPAQNGVGWTNPNPDFDFSDLGVFLAVGILITLTLAFSYSAIGVLLISAIGALFLGLSGLMPFQTAFITGFATIVIGFATYLMRS